MKTKLLLVVMVTVVGFYAAIGSQAASGASASVTAKNAELAKIMAEIR